MNNQVMNKGFSLYLDALRAIAALIVFASHFAYERFTGGAYSFVRDYNLGSDAVIVFFVMSGFLIAFTAERAENAAHFAKARIARLYSVALPAIALTFAFDAVGRAADPSLYVPPWDLPDAAWLEALRAATFTNENWFSNDRLGTNGPYWSLAYEAWYYILFGVFVFTRGALRASLIAACCLFIGPRILLLAPCWLAGVWLYHCWYADDSRPDVSAGMGVLFFTAPILAYLVLQVAGAPHFLYDVTKILIGQAEPGYLLGFSNEFLWNYLLAALTAAHLIGAHALAGRFKPMSGAAKLMVRWPAQRSFALYLFHYPILSCFAAFLDSHGLINHLLLGAGALVLSYLFAELTERRLALWRRWTEALFSAAQSGVNSLASRRSPKSS